MEILLKQENKMKKKDYIIIATALGQAYSEAKSSTEANRIIEHICHALQVDNPAFNENQFKNYVRLISQGKALSR